MRKRKAKSIKKGMIFPVVVILSIQMLIQILFYQYGGIMSMMRGNSMQIFSETARHQQLNIERELFVYWMNSIRDSGDMATTVEEVLRENNCTPEDISQNPELNNKIILELTDRLIEVLHYGNGNGIYMVLNGPASVNGKAEEQAGILIHDTDTSSYEHDYSDLLFVRGNSAIAQKYGIALDKQWEPGFDLGKMREKDFYEKPFGNAIKYKVQSQNADGCAYFGMIKIKEKNESNLSYSVPIILSDNTVIGVIGGEISERRILSFLDNDVNEKQEGVISVLAKKTDNADCFQPVIFGNDYQKHPFKKECEVTYNESGWASVGQIQDKDGNLWYAAMQPLEIYNKCIAVEDENWMVVRIIQEKNLFADINQVRRILMFSVMASFGIGLLILLIVNRMLTNPVRKLLENVRQADANGRPQLGKIHIQEFDELVDEVNRLNKGVAEHASKISRIFDALDMEIGVFEYDVDQDKVFCSYLLLKILGIPCKKGMYKFMDADAFSEKVSQFANPMPGEDGKTYEFVKDNELHYIRMKIMETENKGTIGVLMDVTAEINERRRLEQERDSDSLTGLYNRSGFRNKLQSIFKEKKTELAAFIMWDMDNLKYVNDTYGHEVGDSYIRMFAKQLQELEKAGAIVGRRSGDEFMAVLYGGNEQKLRFHIETFMGNLKQRMLEVQDGEQIPLRASAGVSWYPRHGTKYEDLIRYADFAMYMSKHSYKGIVQEFDAETYQTNAYLLSGREELNQILESQNIKFALQPIVTRNGEIYGYEMLMRPTLKKLKNISEVLHLAKLQAKLPQFENLTWSGALKWVSERENSLAPNARIFINSIANMQMNEETIKSLEHNYSSILSRVVLELTETEEADCDFLKSKVTSIRRWGILLALDDYGAGYSNDATLLQIEPDVVKMDRTLVRGIHINQNQQIIARHLIAYCHSRNIMVVAEGVETKEELEFLMGIQVDLFQGYYIARPDIEIRSKLEAEIVKEMKEIAGE